jgi:transcription antitermination protein NusB
LSRRLARDVAFRALFQIDIGKCRIKPAVLRALEGFSFSEEEKVFVDDLVAGTLGRQEHLDEIIMKHLVKWKLERISAVDRNLLRLALYEILYRSDIPIAVSINEALELAKKYGSSGEAVGFINGVLDRAVGETLEREH